MNVQIIEDFFKNDPFKIKERDFFDNRYTILQKLGDGLTGDVFLVENDKHEKSALKILKSVQRGIKIDEAKENFKGEFSLLTELNPHVLQNPQSFSGTKPGFWI